MLKRFLIIMLLITSCTGIIFAESGFDDADNPNDPNDNERANACYEGGTLEGKCTNELEWTAGWYLIRYEYGLYGVEDIPAWVAWILPQESVPEEIAAAYTHPADGCYTNGSKSFRLTGAINSTNNVNGGDEPYTSTDCTVTIEPDPGLTGTVNATDLAAATAMCESISTYPVESVTQWVSRGYNTPATWWECIFDDLVLPA